MRFTKFFSSILAFVMVLSLLSPFTALANGDQSLPFKTGTQSESDLLAKAAIVEQLNLLGGEARLHEDLKKVSGNEQVAVIVHLSEKPVALEQGIEKLKGKSLSKAQSTKVKANVKAQQAMIKKEMKNKKISFKEGYSYDTVLNGFAVTVKADDLSKLLEIEGVTLIEPDVTVYALEDSPAKIVKEEQVDAAMNTSISFLGIEKLWNEGIEGQGIKVAVLDTGIDANHPEFQGVYKGGKNFIPNSSTYTKTRADDDASETSPVERPVNTPEFNEKGSAFYTSHGTHVAGTIAAIGANEYGIKGIAPKVDLYAYRVLGAYGSGATSGIVKAIDTAVIEGMDVINLSLGGGSNTETDAGSFAINNAMLAGTISVIATGNSGPNRGTMGTPATARLGIAVGNTTNPETMYDGKVNVSVGSYNLSKQLKLMGTTFGTSVAKQLEGEFDLVAVPGLGEAIDYNGIDVKGKVALISRGSIAFVDKIANAKANGAVAAIIHNFAGGTNAPNASGTFLGDSFDFIPTFDMSQTDGDAIRAALKDGAGKITFGNFGSSSTVGDDVNDSSSRGPSTPNFDIKPDVTAPGTNIMSTIPMYKADFPNVKYDKAYDRKTGTSMATPHIAGIAALVKQANPTWNAFDVKVALSNTAKILNTAKYDVFSQGAGRVDAYAAAHPNILAYAIDNAVLDGTGAIVENLKGTVTFGPQSLKENISVTKQILVKDVKGLGGDYKVTVDVKKSFGDAKLTVDQPTFTLAGEQLLNVTLTASKATAPNGSELLGYIHINGGGSDISLPFAADFSGVAKTEIKNMSISETDLSFNGDGVKDSAVLAFTLTGDVTTNYIELWDIMNPEGGEYGDGYIGYLHAGSSLGKGSYTLNITGQYKPWGSAPATTIPDGLYTIDYTASTASGVISDYVGPIVVKSTKPEIIGAVDGELATGQVNDKYIDYNEELYLYGLDYDLNDKLHASYITTQNGEKAKAVEFKLAQDGSFSFPVTAETDSVTVVITDAAGNVGEALIYKKEEAAPVVTLSVDQTDLKLSTGETTQLAVTETTKPANGESTNEDVTAKATYVVADENIATVSNGLVTALSEGSTTVTISYGGNEVTVNVKVTKPVVVEPVVTLTVDKPQLKLKPSEEAQVTIKEVTTTADGKVTEKDVTKLATYEVANNNTASVSRGLVKAKGANKSTTITVRYGGHVVTIEVEVVSPGKDK
ncbi:S8 family serine peptidase [Psychrobacillus sp. NPDC058041]|uniref:S8 family serine peptidase n=1 Tax=Psychrobacillus sp. NPDC058041 TaxID=3346310 RepID=UPI0036D9CC9D